MEGVVVLTCSPTDSFVVLQFADDLDVLSSLPQHLPDLLDVSCLADKRGEDHVDAHVHSKLKVLDVLLRHGGQVHGRPRQVDALLAAQRAAIFDLAYQVVRAYSRREGN